MQRYFMQRYLVTIKRHPVTYPVIVRARSHEEAEREALAVIGKDYAQVDEITVKPLSDADADASFPESATRQ